MRQPAIAKFHVQPQTEVLRFNCSAGGQWLSNYWTEARIQEQLKAKQRKSKEELT